MRAVADAALLALQNALGVRCGSPQRSARLVPHPVARGAWIATLTLRVGGTSFGGAAFSAGVTRSPAEVANACIRDMRRRLVWRAEDYERLAAACRSAVAAIDAAVKP